MTAPTIHDVEHYGRHSVNTARVHVSAMLGVPVPGRGAHRHETRYGTRWVDMNLRRVLDDVESRWPTQEITAVTA